MAADYKADETDETDRRSHLLIRFIRYQNPLPTQEIMPLTHPLPYIEEFQRSQ